MRPLARSLASTLIFSITLAGTAARAQDDTPTKSEVPATQTAAPAPAMVGAPAAVAAVPEAAWRAMLHRGVTLIMRDGREVSGELIASEPDLVTLILDGSRVVEAFQKTEVTGLRAGPVAPVYAPASGPGSPALYEDHPAAPVQPDRRRIVGVQLGFTPGLMVDAQYRSYYGFVAGALAMPIIGGTNWLAFTAGLGGTFPISPNSRWRFDVFAEIAPARLNSSNPAVGLGAGIGAHYTGSSGITVGFKVPIFGYGVGKGAGSGKDAAEFFYLASALGLPLISVGYRF